MKSHCSFLVILLCATRFFSIWWASNMINQGVVPSEMTPLTPVPHSYQHIRLSALTSKCSALVCLLIFWDYLRHLQQRTGQSKESARRHELMLVWAPTTPTVSNSWSLLHSWIVQSYSTSFGEDFKHNKVSELPFKKKKKKKKNILQPFSHQFGICVLFPTCGPSRTD